MTERNEAEEKLKESEKNYREFYEWTFMQMNYYNRFLTIS